MQSNQRHNFLGHIRRPFDSKGSKAVPAESKNGIIHRNIRTREQGFRCHLKNEMQFLYHLISFKEKHSQVIMEGNSLYPFWQSFWFPVPNPNPDPNSVFQLWRISSPNSILLPPVIRDVIISYPSETRGPPSGERKKYFCPPLLNSCTPPPPPPPPPMFCPRSCPLLLYWNNTGGSEDQIEFSSKYKLWEKKLKS